MPQYTRKAQVPFTEEQYLTLMSIARKEHKPLDALLREAADLVYFQKKRNPGKARAVRGLLSLKETEVPGDYQEWEHRYLDDRACRHG